MKREIKNNGEYLEVDSGSLLSNAEAMSAAQIVVVKNTRFEFAGDEKTLFLRRLKWLLEKHSAEISSFSEEQKCDFVMRKMLLDSSSESFTSVLIGNSSGE